MPAALLRDHTTKTGVWARIVVREGALRYHVDRFDVHVDVTPDAPAIVVPEVPHHIEPLGAVRFHVELYRVDSRSEEP